MAKPQQPEIARSGRGATDPAAVKSALTAQRDVSAETDAGPVPEDNQPGHHPENDQDKPTGERFLRRVKEHATSTPRSEQAAHLAGTPFRVAAGVIRKVRERLD